MRVLICDHCNELYETSKSNVKYCSEECKKEIKKRYDQERNKRRRKYGGVESIYSSKTNNKNKITSVRIFC